MDDSALRPVPAPAPAPALVSRLRAAGCVFAEEEAALLEAAVAGIPPARAAEALERLVARRVLGEPLETLLGWAEFGGIRILLEPGVFVPRRRTERLAETAAGFAREVAASGRRPVVVDLCCGAGAIGAVIADAAGPLDLFAADLDPAAVLAARRNLEPRGGRVFEGDLFEALPDEIRGRVDVLAVNAPYVPTGEIAMMPAEARDHEARMALDGGDDGLDVHRRVAASARLWLAPGGRLLIESSRRQARTTLALIESGRLVGRVETDDERGATVVVGVHAGGRPLSGTRAGSPAPRRPSSA
jgi:release factor glutamine methyltransferase